jgi:phosphatidylethanolamine/phosphatidyl-N-methylethanolamine N-methyltransferase
MTDRRAGGDLDGRAVARAYAAWAPVYDAIWGPILAPGRRAAAKAASRLGGRILEVGVGTGVAFADYAPDVEVIGIDLSPRMIARAHKRLTSGLYPQARAVLVMDAHHLAFADATFDAVVMPFVITLVSAPEQALSEALRVLRPEGELILVSHLRAETGGLAAIARWVAPLSGLVGLRPDFPFRRIADWAGRRGDVAIVETRRILLLAMFTLVRMRRRSTGVLRRDAHSRAACGTRVTEL